METMKEKLAAAMRTETSKEIALTSAAIAFADDDSRTKRLDFHNLKEAAKAWTSAYHQRSRCAKHVRETISATCILTGAEGENPDDCTTHEHEVRYECSECGADFTDNVVQKKIAAGAPCVECYGDNAIVREAGR